MSDQLGRQPAITRPVEPLHVTSSQRAAGRLLHNARRIAAGFLIVELILAVTTEPTDFRSLTLAYVLLGAAIATLTYVIFRPTPRRAVWAICILICALQLANLAPTDSAIA
ncbi:MAG: hypothetical protein WC054_07450, partial [Candidatus Nanopelagicales bacterium]